CLVRGGKPTIRSFWNWQHRYLVGLPMVEMHSIGAGGGSIACVEAGALRVGPESAKADPGPICYGRGGTRPTVTDANVVLGRLAADRFLSGDLRLDVPAAVAALDRLGTEAGLTARPGLDLARTAALGVVGVSTARMERALRRISLERGHDPRDFALVSFGGAGGLHACDLARSLGIRTVLVPPGASTLSAYGMLAADVVKDHVQTVMLPGETPAAELERLLEPLVERGEREIAEEGVPPGNVSVHRLLDTRYVGQGYEVTIPFGGDFVGRFHRTHEKVYGHAEPSAPVEVVNLRVRVVGEVAAPPLPEEEAGPADPSPTLESRREVVVTTPDFEGAELVQVPFYDGAGLRCGVAVNGPAVIVHKDTTVYLSPADHATVDRHLNLVVEVHG
ncbi:MAG: hydantoinase/oxoprolinase family protein, partial [Gemmatimonadetes bacterium]|nr:hydantoinase/oxoprolinase family protein [Gemmatimonadota bacterium]